MKREEKNSLSRQRIMDAAMQEFSAKGYAGAALNAVCAEHDISKGIVYHYFKDKDELYVACVEACFGDMTAYLRTAAVPAGSLEEKLQAYFSARSRFFAEHPVYLGIFADAAFHPAPELEARLAECRREFDALNIGILTEMLQAKSLRDGLTVPMIVDDFRAYMDFFNMRFRAAERTHAPMETVLREHEERCFRQLRILLHGVLEEEK